jgi:hypothetical protein
MTNKRCAERRAIAMPARLSWKDSRGRDNVVSVVTRDVSDLGVFVESRTALSIPLYRLVHFQIETGLRVAADLPRFLARGRVLTAVYRISGAEDDRHHGLALRLIQEPGDGVAAVGRSMALAPFNSYGASS